MTEEEWYDKVYRGDDVPQLTIRAVLMGSILGFFLAFTNLYIGLKTGWALGVAITASILAYAASNASVKMGFSKTPLTILETNCMASTASSAGYATGGTMVSAIAALLMISATPENPQGEHLPWTVLVLWTLFLAAMGTMLAIPMKRNMINQERLKFPSGTAAAVTLQSLFSEGVAAMRKARALTLAAIIGGVFPFLLELNAIKESVVDKATGIITTTRHALLPADSAIFDWLPNVGSHIENGKEVPYQPSDWTMVMDHNPVMIAAGALVGLRVAISMVLGGLVLIFFVGPEAYDTVWMSPAGDEVRAATKPWKAWKEIGLWLGVPIMVSSGLLSFAFQWRTIVRAFTSILSKTENRDGNSERDELIANTEVPLSWFVWGSLVSGAGVIAVAYSEFEIPIHYGILGVLLTFALSLVACRATGESDITPVGAMGKIMQLTFGVLIPQSATANLMTASITASSAGSAADLLNDLKSGYLLGANPRRQFFAQLAGIFSGTIATVMGFYLLVPDATAITGVGDQAPDFPAPSAQAWKAVADVFSLGIENMHPMHQAAILWGLGLGALLLVLENMLPKFKDYLPSATGLGLGLILPFQYPLSMLLGAVFAAVWTKANKASADELLVPIAAGVIAGISLMGVLVAILNTIAFPS
jgi:OPT family oligopeptide transporter